MADFTKETSFNTLKGLPPRDVDSFFNSIRQEASQMEASINKRKREILRAQVKTKNIKKLLAEKDVAEQKLTKANSDNDIISNSNADQSIKDVSLRKLNTAQENYNKVYEKLINISVGIDLDDYEKTTIEQQENLDFVEKLYTNVVTVYHRLQILRSRPEKVKKQINNIFKPAIQQLKTSVNTGKKILTTEETAIFNTIINKTQKLANAAPIVSSILQSSTSKLAKKLSSSFVSSAKESSIFGKIAFGILNTDTNQPNTSNLEIENTKITEKVRAPRRKTTSRNRIQTQIANQPSPNNSTAPNAINQQNSAQSASGQMNLPLSDGSGQLLQLQTPDSMNTPELINTSLSETPVLRLPDDMNEEQLSLPFSSNNPSKQSKNYSHDDFSQLRLNLASEEDLNDDEPSSNEETKYNEESKNIRIHLADELSDIAENTEMTNENIDKLQETLQDICDILGDSEKNRLKLAENLESEKENTEEFDNEPLRLFPADEYEIPKANTLATPEITEDTATGDKSTLSTIIENSSIFKKGFDVVKGLFSAKNIATVAGGAAEAGGTEAAVVGGAEAAAATGAGGAAASLLTPAALVALTAGVSYGGTRLIDRMTGNAISTKAGEGMAKVMEHYKLGGFGEAEKTKNYLPSKISSGELKFKQTEDLRAVLEKEGITDSTIQNAVIGQAYRESELKADATEKFNYTTEEGIKLNFGKTLKAQNIDPKSLIKNPQKLAEAVYGPNSPKGKALGNTLPGEGWKYRGRGYVQITGKKMYEDAGKSLNLDLVNNPDLASDPENSGKIIAWYMKKYANIDQLQGKDQETILRATTSAVVGKGLNLESGVGLKRLEDARAGMNLSSISEEQMGRQLLSKHIAENGSQAGAGSGGIVTYNNNNITNVNSVNSTNGGGRGLTGRPVNPDNSVRDLLGH